MGKEKKKRAPGSLKGEMRMRINDHTKGMSNKTRRNYLKASEAFAAWVKNQPDLSNSVIRKNPRAALEAWRDALLKSGYAVSTVHTYIAGAACGLGTNMRGIARSGISRDKSKSLGCSERSQKACERKENQDVVRFQEMVGGRRNALQRLTGSDFVQDESGHWSIRFLGDKGGKDQYQRIDPQNYGAVKAYFDLVGPEERLFPEPIDRHLDLHGIRAEVARKEYQRYKEICSTPKGRVQMRQELLARYTDPQIGCKAYLEALREGKHAKAQRHLAVFREEMKDGVYYLQRSNRQIARSRRLPVGYDRLALCCVGVLVLSHWRNEVTVKHYML
jgi:hypothetical protein